jgi:hypothetical protein
LRKICSSARGKIFKNLFITRGRVKRARRRDRT